MNATGPRVRWAVLALLMTAPLSSLHARAEDQAKELVRGNTEFAVDLYQRERAGNGNLFFSPYSISSALGMTYAGARGQTEKEMARVLHFGSNPATVHAGFRKLNDRVKEIGSGGKVSLNIANSLWCQKSYLFTEAFLKLNHDFYKAEARLVDFMTGAESVRDQINSWVATNTQDKIQNLISPGALTASTRLVLCNAIYFKGKWTSQFDPKVTGPEPFHTGSGEVQAMLMRQTLSLRSHNIDDGVLFALPYTDGNLSMLILLPDAVDGLASIEKNLTAARLRQWLDALDQARETKAQLFLPRFKLDLRLDLGKTLSAMGMPSAFGPKADFSGMSARGDLFISDVIHQAFVEVNEEGTEAAAATAVTMRATSFSPIRQLRVDHPFLFLIRENQTGNLLFLGRVLSPTK
jgi:serine protease inhibitor